MPYEALKALDRIPREMNVYRLTVELSSRAHQLDRSKFGPQKTDPIQEVFKEVLQDTIHLNKQGSA